MNDTNSTTSDNVTHPIVQLFKSKPPCPFCADKDSGFARNARPLEDELIAALEEIADPILFMRARAESEGKSLNGSMCVAMSESAAYLKSIATAALARARGEATNG